MLEYYFLIIIFIGFIVYGISDTMLGSVWPTYAKIINANISSFGLFNAYVSVVAALVSSNAYKLRKKVGNNFSLVVGMASIAIAVFIYSIANRPWMLALALFFLGLGQGVTYSISNNYVVKYYKAKDVSYLQACLGIGSAIGPLILVYSLSSTNGLNKGFYIIIALIVALIIIYLLTKTFWEQKKKTLSKELVDKYTISQEEKQDKKNVLDVFKLKHSRIYAFILIIGYASNGMMNAWLATILIVQRGITAVEGATAASIFFLSVTMARVVIGFVSGKLSTELVIKLCLVFSIITTGLLCVPIHNISIIYLTAALLGVTIAPFAPFITYNMKAIFGEGNLAIVTGLLTVCTLAGTALASFIAGFIIKFMGANSIPYALLICLIVTLISYIYLDKNVLNK